MERCQSDSHTWTSKEPSLAKYYRPKSLLSFMLKTLERLIMDEFLREETLTRHPLQEFKDAYQRWKSIEISLHLSVTNIEYTMQEKQYIMAVFMDIQGAFNSTTFAVIQEALESHDVGRTVIRWTVNMLKLRNIHLTYQGESAEARDVKGRPKGGVLPPLLWCMVRW